MSKMQISLGDIFDHLSVNMERSNVGFNDFIVEVSGGDETIRCRCDRENARNEGADRIAEEVLAALAKKDDKWGKYDKEYLSKLLQSNLKFFGTSSQVLKLSFVTEALK